MFSDFNQWTPIQGIIIKLIQRIDLHELNAGLAEDQVFARQLHEVRERCIGPRVAIMKWQTQQRFFLGEISVIDAPGINTEPVYLLRLFSDGAETVLDFVVEL